MLFIFFQPRRAIYCIGLGLILTRYLTPMGRIAEGWWEVFELTTVMSDGDVTIFTTGTTSISNKLSLWLRVFFLLYHKYLARLALLSIPIWLTMKRSWTMFSITPHWEVMKIGNCCVFKTFILLGALRGGEWFMSAVTNRNEEAQEKNHLLKHWSVTNRLKWNQIRIIINQFKLSTIALEEKMDFLNTLHI